MSPNLNESAFCAEIAELPTYEDIQMAVARAKRDYKAQRVFLGNLTHFIANGTLPAGIQPGEFHMFRAIAQRLVERGMFKASALDVFSN